MDWLKKIFGKDVNSLKNNKLAFDFVHRNPKWGFSLGYQKSWTIISEEQPEGAWIHPIVLAKEENGARIAVCILSIGKLGESGSIEYYIKKAKSDLSGSFRDFKIIDATEKKIGNWPAAWMHYTYSENGKTSEEYNVTFFYGKNVDIAFLPKNVDVPFQIICFTDSNRFQKIKSEFLDIIHSLSFPNNFLWLSFVSLYGNSNLICKSCRKNIDPNNSTLAVKFPENELEVICNDCKGL
jgi:hypothetical protein